MQMRIIRRLADLAGWIPTELIAVAAILMIVVGGWRGVNLVLMIAHLVAALAVLGQSVWTLRGLVLLGASTAILALASPAYVASPAFHAFQLCSLLLVLAAYEINKKAERLPPTDPA